MPEYKPDREILRIYGILDESGNAHRVMIASQAPQEVIYATLKLAVLILEKGQSQHIKDIHIKDPGDIKFHTEG